MKILVTGGAGFVGSHAAEFFAKKGDEIVILDNVSRDKILGKKEAATSYNSDYLKERYDNISLLKCDIRNAKEVEDLAKDADAIIHAAAQTAVTTSLTDPRTDFEINALGTFNVLEAARKARTRPVVIYCSTNKVYGNNVNTIKVKELDKRYVFQDTKYANGIAETFPTDLCEHTPYGCSKFTGDVYVQDYAERGLVDAAVFRMSCIYGTRQFGVEDQGWVAWFTIATILGKPITIYGNGKQVRDVLYATDLVKAFDLFMKRRDRTRFGVYNMGGGPENTLSLLELVDYLEELTGKKSKIGYDDWRPSDQKVYISDIAKAKKELGWSPETGPKNGVRELSEWVLENRSALEK